MKLQIKEIQTGNLYLWEGKPDFTSVSGHFLGGRY
jgi:hypothetical protein